MKHINLIINSLTAVSISRNTADACNAQRALSSQKLPAFTTFCPVFSKQGLEITCKYITGGFANRYHDSFILLANAIKCGVNSDIKNFITIFV